LAIAQKAKESDESLPQNSRLPALLSAVSLAGAAIQGVCAILVASSSLKLLLGVAAIAGAVKSSAFHSDGIRIPLLLISTALASLTLFILWNGWRLRRRPAARWRIRPLSRGQKLSMWFSFAASIVTWLLVIGEIVEHPIRLWR